MPIVPFPVSGKVYASNGTTPFPDVKVYLRNKTRNEEEYVTTNSSGEYFFDLGNFNSGWATGDSLELRAELGSFYKGTTTTLSGESWETTLTLTAVNNFRRIDLNMINEELVTHVRNNVSDPNSRGTDKTAIFTGDGSTVKFTLPETTAKNIKFVMVGSTMKTRYSDYYVDYKDKANLSKPVIYLLTPPADGTLVEIKYNYGESWVYTDFPRLSLKNSDYPRIKIGILSVRTEEFGLGADFNISDMLVEVIVWSKRTNQLEDIVKEIRDNLMRNKKDFHFFKLIIPSTIGPMLPATERGDSIVQRNCDYIIKFKPEEV